MSKHRHVHVHVYIFFCVYRDLESSCDRQVGTWNMVRQAWSNSYCVKLKRPCGQITRAFCRHTRRRFECTTHGGVLNPHTGISACHTTHHNTRHHAPQYSHTPHTYILSPRDGELCVVCGCVACVCVFPCVCELPIT